MKSIRLAVLTAVTAASLGLTAAPASACQPENPCPPCSKNETWNNVLRKLGHPCP